jgi:aspartyl-tRNA(Asn)/glutamyl-tRNA(Gln) amidotransferase subunit A
MAELADLTVTELLDAYRRGEASPVEAVRSCIARTEAIEPSINAVVTLSAERCVDGAAESERRWRNGAARPLEGVPIGVKDIIETAGILTTGGSVIYADLVPDENAAVVDRLTDAGALLLAKHQTYEFALGDNSHYGPTRNPWDLARTPGGSSTGSAAALAARELPLAVGTDTGGSIRVPSTFSGITGLKATLGRIPRDGVMVQSWTLDHVGPMARSARDAALAYEVMSGATEPNGPQRSELAGRYVRGLRIGVPVDWFFDVIDNEAAAATRAAVEVFRADGAAVQEVRLPHVHLADAIGWVIMFAEFAALHEAAFDRLDDYSRPLSQRLVVASQFVHATDYLRAQRALHLLQHDFEAAFDRVDVLIVPGMAGVAPRLDDMRFEFGGRSFEWGDLVAHMTMVFNLIGAPAVAIPAGLSTGGLPLGIQIAAPPFGDYTCLRAAHWFQLATDHHRLVPPMLAGAASAR